MPTYAAASIRNVAVVGHNGSGKTQLISALLFTAGATTRLGRVDDGTAPTDFDEEAIVRKHTLAATPAWLDWHGTKVNLVDTPGFGNFLSETGATLRVTDAALVVVDAVAGVEVQTERVWALADDEQLAKFVVINRLDRERASFATALEDLHAAFGRTLVPVQLPYGEEKGFRGVIDLVAQRAYTYEGGTGRGKPVAIPGEHRGRGQERARSARGTGGGSRRRPDVAVLRRGDAQPTTNWWRDCVRPCARVRSCRCSAPPGPRTSAPIASSRRWCTTRHHRWIGRCRPSRSRAATRSRRWPTRAARRACSSGRRWPIRSPAASRCSGSSPASCATTAR